MASGQADLWQLPSGLLTAKDQVPPAGEAWNYITTMGDSSFIQQIFEKPPVCQALCWTMELQQSPAQPVSSQNWHVVGIYCTQ